jgi:hypothetical protein
VPFVDLARAAAVLFMVQGHALQVLMAPAYHASAFAQAWLFLRGLTSCTFLMLSGFSFGLATARRWPECSRPGPRARRRLARDAMLVAIGYAMRFPARSLATLGAAGPEQWQAFAVVDVLQLIGVSLAVLQAAAWLPGSRRAFAVRAWLAAAAVVVAAPLLWPPARTSALPAFVSAYLTSARGSLFPAFPWAAYILFGAGLGAWHAREEREGAGDRAALFLALGAGMVMLGAILHAVPWSPYGAIEFWAVSPNLFLVKGGSVLVLLSGAIYATRGVELLPRVVTALSRESLLVYLVHVVLLYGSAWSVGLTESVGARLGPGPVVGCIAALLSTMTLMAWAWHECKRQLSALASAVRLGAVTLLLYTVIFAA